MKKATPLTDTLTEYKVLTNIRALFLGDKRTFKETIENSGNLLDL